MSLSMIYRMTAIWVIAALISACSRFAVPTPTSTPIPVTILLIEGDEDRLPDRLSEPLLEEHPPSTQIEIAHVPADAVLISREKLFDPANREDLRKIIDSQKILLVYGASSSDIRRELKLDKPSATTGASRSIVGAAFRSDKAVVGGALVSRGDREEDLLRAVCDYVILVKSTLQKMEK